MGKVIYHFTLASCTVCLFFLLIRLCTVCQYIIFNNRIFTRSSPCALFDSFAIEIIDPFALISLELSTAYPPLVMATSKSPNTSSSSSSSASFDELPRETWWENVDLYKCDGFWYGLPHLVAAVEGQSSFKARDDDVLLASSMKTGTTWLKALIPCIMDPYARLVNDDDDGNYQDPLIQSHPNELIPSLEVQIFAQNSTYDISGMTGVANAVVHE